MIYNNLIVGEGDEASFKAIFEYAKLGILMVDHKGYILNVNPFCEKLFGYQKDELLQKPVEILIPQKFHQDHIAARRAYNLHPQARQMGAGLDLFALKKNGEEFPVEISLGSYEQNGERISVAFISDISLRKEAEAKAEAYLQDLERQVNARTAELMDALKREKELNHIKSRFVSLASHEFRTPLSTILTSITLIDRYAEDEQLEKRNKHIKRVKSSVKMLSNIINDFLSLDKLENGQIDTEADTFELDSFMHKLAEEMEVLLKNGQRIEVQVPSSPLEVFLNQKLLKNILVNLTSNAIKYSPENKPICLRADLQADEVHLFVKDEGIGIPDEDQASLFNTFFRAGNVGSRQGTGLGLSIVKKYVELLNGHISFQSKEGQGTTFQVRIPIATDTLPPE